MYKKSNKNFHSSNMNPTHYFFLPVPLALLCDIPRFQYWLVNSADQKYHQYSVTHIRYRHCHLAETHKATHFKHLLYIKAIVTDILASEVVANSQLAFWIAASTVASSFDSISTHMQTLWTNHPPKKLDYHTNYSNYRSTRSTYEQTADMTE